ncbi:MAG: EAL domain-containing protein [Bacillota bacterium]|nr:EAL domain-containing protein [Bacillota bacterium]
MHEKTLENWVKDELEKLRARVSELESREDQLLKKLRHKEAFYLKILDELPINIFLEDSDGHTIFANKQACEANGLKLEELVGKTVHDFFPEYIANKVRQDDLQVWEEKRLITQEVITGFKGKESHALTGKTIIHINESEEDFLLGFALDISDRVRAETLLRESEEKFRNLIEQAADSLFLLDLHGQIINVNSAACELLGYTKEELLQKKGNVLFNTLSNKISTIFKDVSGNKSSHFEDKIKGKEAIDISVDINLRQVQIGDRPLFLAMCRDIRDKKKAEAMMEHMAYHDALTGLPNRWFIESKLQHILTFNDGLETRFGILLLDLDRFKVINDSLGHQSGDLLLKKVTERLQKVMEEGCVLARFGGDEFIVLVPKLQENKRVCMISEKIMGIMEEPFTIHDQKFTVTTSIGISIYPEDGMDANTLIKNADLAMYRSKDQGRNEYTFFNVSMNEFAIDRMDKEILLRQALENNEFVLYYQPKMNIHTGDFQGVEALIRWKKNNEILYPDSFIHIAEETGLIVPIGEWVIREACRQCKAWHDSGMDKIMVSVNISMQQFHKQKLEELIAAILQETQLSPESLELELTESTVMKNPKEAAIVLNNLKALGISISIDDFGTGFSSLSYLKHFPIDILKIDRSFITNLEWDEANTAIASAVISMARSLNMKVVAEGIETKEQLDFLKGKNCDFAQGYLISRPLEESHITHFLERNLKYNNKTATLHQ